MRLCQGNGSLWLHGVTLLAGVGGWKEELEILVAGAHQSPGASQIWRIFFFFFTVARNVVMFSV